MQIEHTIIEIGWPGGQKINNKKILFTIVPNIFSQNLNLKTVTYMNRIIMITFLVIIYIIFFFFAPNFSF